MDLNDRGIYPPGTFGFPAARGHSRQRPQIIRHLPPRTITEASPGVCAVCGQPATRFVGIERVCGFHGDQADRIAAIGVTNPLSVLITLSGERQKGDSR